jgi:hypothetical protein
MRVCISYTPHICENFGIDLKYIYQDVGMLVVIKYCICKILYTRIPYICMNIQGGDFSIMGTVRCHR